MPPKTVTNARRNEAVAVPVHVWSVGRDDALSIRKYADCGEEE